MPEITSSADNKAAANDEDDFFSSWDKAPTPSTKPATSTPTPPPVIGRATPPQNSTPRTVSSSSIRTTSTTNASRPTSNLKSSRLASSNTSSITSATGPKKPKLGGLGAKKAAIPLDFDQAEKQAAEEVERVKQLGYDRQKEEEEERARTQKRTLELKPTLATIPTKQPAENTNTTPQPRGSQQDMERLGMGMKKLGFGSVPQKPASTRYDNKLLLEFHTKPYYQLTFGSRHHNLRSRQVRRSKGHLIRYVLWEERLRSAGR